MSTENSPDFNEILPKPGSLKSFSLANTAKTPKFDLDRMNQDELLDLHAKIEAKLTGLSLADVNLEKEALIQLKRAKALQEKASTGSDVPMNQQAQVQNSIRNILEGLASLQIKLHDSETMKRWKAALIRSVKAQPKDFQVTFFTLLEDEAQVVEQEMVD